MVSPSESVNLERRAVAERFLTGHGIEVGAGDRPFPVPSHVRVFYGDIRDAASVEDYFKTADVRAGSPIDAQTFAGVADASLDFVISAHVIEHLRDPIGSIVNAIRRRGGPPEALNIHLGSMTSLRDIDDPAVIRTETKEEVRALRRLIKG